MKCLPNRYPFLLVDRVLNINGDKIVGLKNVSANEPFFRGHLLGDPIMPGVLMVEMVAQLGVIWAYKKGKSKCLLTSVKEFVFRKSVYPGDTLIGDVQVKLKENYGVLMGCLSVGKEKVCNGSLSFVCE